MVLKLAYKIIYSFRLYGRKHFLQLKAFILCIKLEIEFYWNSAYINYNKLTEVVSPIFFNIIITFIGR